MHNMTVFISQYARWTVSLLGKELGVKFPTQMPLDLLEVPVRFVRRMTTTFGSCSRQTTPTGDKWSEIKINPRLTTNNAALKDTLLHELGHAWAWIHYGAKGHGQTWKNLVKLLGHSGERLSSYEKAKSVALPQRKRMRKKYVGMCGKCKLKVFRAQYLKQGAQFTHRGCGGVFLPVVVVGMAAERRRH